MNLYPFAQQRRTHDDDSLIEWIDIGGPALIRAAAKNHARVTVLCQPHQYDEFLAQLGEHGGRTTPSYRRQCAAAAFAHTQRYDHDVAQWLKPLLAHDDTTDELPPTLSIVTPLFQKTRYGENPHQKGGFYGSAPPSVAHATRHQGKELSWNNIHDTDAALAVVCDHDAAAAIIKHATLCGAARDDSIDEALHKAIAADPTSAFGGIIALNRPCTKSCAELITQSFFEVILAPAIDTDALAVFAGRSNLRVLSDEALFAADKTACTCAVCAAASLSKAMTSNQTTQFSGSNKRAINSPKPNKKSWHGRGTWCVMCAPMALSSRNTDKPSASARRNQPIDALKHAVNQAQHYHSEKLHNATLASDAFFPFADAIEVAADAGIQTIIASGGSMRDKDVIAACEKYGITLVFAPNRHFKH